jgi:branched-chain amino acid transport system permease protein
MKRLSLRVVWMAVAIALLLGVNIAKEGLLNSVQDVLIQCGIAIILAVSLNIVNGLTGQFSIGHAGFMAVGAYVGGALSFPMWSAYQNALSKSHSTLTSAQILSNFGTSHWWLLPTAMLLGGAVAALFGWMVGVPSLRLRGDYLAIVTLGFGEIIRVLLNNTNKISPKLEYLGGALGFYGLPKITNFMFIYGTAILVIVQVLFARPGLPVNPGRRDCGGRYGR